VQSRELVEERIAAPGSAGGGLIIGGNDNNGEPSWPPLLIDGHRSGAARWGNDVRGIGSSVVVKDRGFRDKHITRQERRILPFPANGLGDLFLQKSGADGGGAGSTH
jgi:hypothetical protein